MESLVLDLSSLVKQILASDAGILAAADSPAVFAAVAAGGLVCPKPVPGIVSGPHSFP